MLNLWKRYLIEDLDESGNPVPRGFSCPENFNFAYDVVDVLGAETPERRAMLWRSVNDEKHTFTFKDMKDMSDRAASFFLSLGIRKGDMVMLILKRHYQFWFAILGLHKIGAVAVPATNQLRKDDLDYRFKAANIHSVVCTLQPGEMIAESVEKAAADYGKIHNLIGVGGSREGWLDFDGGLASADPFDRPTGDDATSLNDLMLMYFTSGTTNQPKMVAHDFSYPIAHIATAKYWQKVVPDGLHLTVSETGWAKSVWGKLYGQWLMEAGIYVFDFDRFSPHKILTCIEEDRLTTFCAPPTIYRFLLQENLDSFDLSSLTHVTIAGEALNPEVYEKFLKKTGLELKEGFGQTETTLSVVTNYWMKSKPGAMGKPSPFYDVELLNHEDKPAENHETGEICIRTGGKKILGLFTGYYLDNELTAKVWSNGIYRTGDLAFRDEDGYYWFIGRKDDIIKSAGYRISAFEVESTLMEHAAVMECAVTGVADEIRGQVIKATIKLAPGHNPSNMLKREIQEFMKNRTAPYKYPRVVDFVDELPKTISGKIRRVELRD
ncbi:MAG: AMP-binding protein [Fastidiosipilaceae bacterium]|jgi:acetyl-CoA synthetase